MLTPQEATDLFGILRTLTREGMSVIFISHKLHEVLEIADRISVLRRGKLVDTVPREGATEQGLARLMVGREVVLRVDKEPASPGETLLEVEDLTVERRSRSPGGARRQLQRARRRDRGNRGRRRQRPDGARSRRSPASGARRRAG